MPAPYPRTSILKLVALFSWAFLGLSGTLSLEPAYAGDKKDLFASVPEAKAADALMRELGVIRHREISINPDAALQGDAPGGGFTFNLFDDASFAAVLDNITRNPSGTTSYSGHLQGIDLGTWTMVRNGDGIVANIHAVHRGEYQVRFDGQGNHAVLQVDPDQYPHVHYVPIPPELSSGDTGRQPSTGNDSGAIIDVMVVYTPTARIRGGGTSAMYALVDLAVTETNVAYANSNILQRIRLVYKGEVDYAETGNYYTDLTRLTNIRDGYLDNLHALRDDYGADLVVMITESMNACGVAWLLPKLSSGYQNYGFSLVRRSCATGPGYTFAHELGHNMGLGHDYYADTKVALLKPFVDYARGYINVKEKWKSIMAYNNECSAAKTTCATVQYFANPDLMHPVSKSPMGNATADSRTALDQSAPIVANYRSTAAKGLMSKSQVMSRPASQRVIAPYWEAQSDVYTLIAVSHPSLSGMNSLIGLQIDAMMSDGSSGGSVSFTLSSKTTQRVFIVTTNTSHTIKSGTPADAQFITLSENNAKSGNLMITPIATHPAVCAVSLAGHCGFRDITSLTFWGAIIVAGTNTGFTLEFVGDLHDSIATGAVPPTVAMTSGVN